MKQLTILLIISPLLGNCQGIYQVNGPNLAPQITQYQKSIDSLKTVVTNYKALIVKYKQDSVNYRIWVSTKNAQMWQKMDSIKVLKAFVNPIIKINDSLKLANYDIAYQFAKYKSQQFIDTIEFIGFPDTGTGNFSKITEKEYNIAPKFTWQILKRYPIVTAEGIKTKEITITELKK